MKQKITKTISVMLALIILYVSAGTVISYAVDTYKSATELESQETSTNNENVKVDVYYAGGKHSKTIELNNMEEKIYIKVAVENAGYLENAQIDLSDCNFNIEDDGTNEGKVQNIDANSKLITLNNIVAGNSIEIALNIKGIDAEEVPSEMFNKDSKIQIAGKYINAKAKEVKISKEIYIHTSWHGEAQSQIEQKIVKFMSLSDNKKILLQNEITTKIENSSLPVKQTEIEVDIPNFGTEKAEEVIVYAKGTASTNGDINAQNFSKENYSYDEATGKLKITVANNVNSEGKVSWEKDVEDVYEVVMIYPEAEENDINTIDLNASVKHTYYNDVDTTSEASANSEEVLDEKGTVLDFDAQIKEEKIAKGYMYSNTVAEENAKRETSYTETYSIGTSYADITDEMKITQKSNSFVSGETVFNGDYTYNKKINASKAEFDRILGKQGKIEILQNGTVVATIDNSLKENENGKLEVDISELNSNIIEIKTSKPQEEGMLNIEIEKAIVKEVEYSLETIKSFTNLKETSVATGTVNEKEVTTEEVEAITLLEEPTLKADVSLNKQTLSTVVENEVEIATVFETNSNDDALYTNPELTIKLPKEISEVNSPRAELLYSDEVKIAEATLEDGEEGKEVHIKMDGTQTQYNDDITNGMKVLVYAGLVADETTTTSTANIDMLYASENGEPLLATKSVTFLAPEKTQAELEADAASTQAQTQATTSTEVPTLATPTENAEQPVKKDVEITISSPDVTNGGTITKGMVITYNVEAKNISDTDLENVKIIIPVPENMKYEGIYSNIDIDEEGKASALIQKIEKGKTAEVSFTYKAEKVGTASIIAQVENNSNITESDKYVVQIEDAGIAIMNISASDGDNISIGDIYIFRIRVDNLLEEKANNINIKYYLPEGIEYIEDDATQEEFSFNYNKNQNVINIKINEINGLENKTVNIRTKIKNTIKNEYTIAKTTFKGKEYTSNKAIINLKANKTGLKVTATEPQSKTIDPGDDIVLEYIINNITDVQLSDVQVLYDAPEGTTIKSIQIEYGGNSFSFNYEEEKLEKLEKTIGSIDAGGEAKVTITLSTNEISTEKDKEISTYLKVEQADVGVVESNEVIYTITGGSEDTTDDSTTSDDDNKKNSINGKVWVDSDRNGRNDKDEKLLSEIKVLLINKDTGAIIKETTTNNDGEYEFAELENGNYLVAFLYDTTKYSITEYQKSGVSRISNSDATEATIKYNDNDTKVALTDILKVPSENLNNIDLGIYESDKFDLSLEKYISKITVNNKSGVKTYNYEDSPKVLAKIDIPAKRMVGSTVIIEYKIVIKNIGNAAGYAKKIVDYLPDDLKFNSELNPGAYQGTDGEIYIEELANTIIKPGESKEVKLVLTKQMTSQNVGTVVNKAEIAASYNEQGLENENSQAKSENGSNAGVASGIISVQTGQVPMYTTLIVTVIAILMTGIYLIKKHVVKN